MAWGLVTFGVLFAPNQALAAVQLNVEVPIVAAGTSYAGATINFVISG